MPSEQAQAVPVTGDRRRELIAAAIEAIAEHGLSHLTLAKVAARAGLSAASVNFHFKSKEALLLATLQHLSDEFDGSVRSAVADAGEDPGAGLLAVVDVMLDPGLSDPAKLAVWYAFISETRARADYQRVCGETDRNFVQTVSELCAKLLSEHADRPADEQALADGLVGLLESQWQEILFHGEGYDRAAAQRRCRAYLASVWPSRFDMPPPALPGVGSQRTEPERASRAVTLPAWTYENEEFFALEREQVFLSSWQVVCHVNDVPEPGDYATFEMLGERAFVIRGRDGRLHAFHNVCRHRAHAVVMGEQGRCQRLITCPYHGWAYEFDGRLRGIPAVDTFATFDRREYGLKPLDFEVFMGFVFVRFRSEGPSVAERLAPYAEELAHYRLEERVALDGFWQQRHPMDWKNVMDNYLEDYHFPSGHPGLSELMERHYDREVAPTGASRLSHGMKEELQRSWSVRHYQKLLPACEHLPEDLRRRWTYITLFPAVNFDLYADKMDFFQMLPLGPGRCLLRGRTYGLPDESREMRIARYLSGRINWRVQTEDNALTASVQGGLRSSSYNVGLLSGKEVVVQGFQDWIRERLPVTRLATAPPAGSVARQNRELAGEHGLRVL